MIPGITLTDGVTTIVVAPMNLRIQLEEPTKPYVDRVMEGVNDDQPGFNAAAEQVILACAQRNHPNLTQAQLREVMDAADLGPLLIAVLTKSGFKPRPLGMAASPQAAASPSPAPVSSATSSTPPDGSPTTSSTDSPGPITQS